MSAAIVRSLNLQAYVIDKDGQRREIKVGDTLNEGDIVKTAIGGGSVSLELSNGKEITLLGNDTFKLDSSALELNSFDPDVTNIADANSLQQAILNGEDLSDLQATAAGGGATAAGGVSLGAAGFDDGGHESNVSADTRVLSNQNSQNTTATNVTAGNLDANEIVNNPTSTAPVNPSVVIDTTKFILPDSVYNKEAYGGIDLGSKVEINQRSGNDLNGFNKAFENSKSVFNDNGISLTTTVAGVTEVDNSNGFFEYSKGWFYNADSGLYIGTDSAAKLIVTSADKVDSYTQSEPNALVITSNIMIDSIYGGNGDTEILIDGIVVANLLTGKGNDNVKVIGDENGGVQSGVIMIDTGSDDDTVVADKNATGGLILSEDGNDSVEILGGTHATGVYLGDGDDSVVVNGGSSVADIYTESGNDTVSIDEAKIDELGIGGIGFVNLGAGDDKLDVKNSDFGDSGNALSDIEQEFYDINAGLGNDTVNIENSNVKRDIALGEGDDSLKAINETKLQNIFGNFGDDSIFIGESSKVQNIAAGMGNDTIEISGLGTVISGVIKGGNAASDGVESGADTFKVTDGAIVGRGILSSAGVMDNTVLVSGAGTYVSSINMGNTKEVSTGKNTITVTDGATITGDVLAGRGVDNIEISDGASVKGIVAGEGYEDVRDNLGADDVITVRNAEVGFVQGGAGDDSITISHGAHVNGSHMQKDGSVTKGYVSGEQGNDTIVITGKNTIIDGDVRGAEETSVQSDNITISDEATVKGSVVGSAGNDDITINNASVESYIRSYAGDDSIRIESGANVNGSINADFGNDIVSIQNSTVGGFVAGYAGDDSINISDSSIMGIIDGGDGNDNISINENSNVQNVNAGNGNDVISVANSTASGWVWGFGGNNEIGISNSSVNQIYGGSGDDSIALENSNTNLIDTNSGNDKLSLNNETGINLNTVKNIESLEVHNDGAKLELNAKDVIDMTDNRNSLNIVGEKDSSGVTLNSDFAKNSDSSETYSATDNSQSARVTFIIEPEQV